MELELELSTVARAGAGGRARSVASRESSAKISFLSIILHFLFLNY